MATLVAREGRIAAVPVGGTHFVEPDYDRGIEKTLRKHLAAHGSRATSTTSRSAATSCAVAATAGGCCRRRASRARAGGRHERTQCSRSECAPRSTACSIDDTFAEAFPMKATRLVITAHNADLGAPRGGVGDRLRDLGDRLRLRGRHRARARRRRDARRPARHSVLIFSMSGKELAKQVERRVGQCVLTCPTTAVFAGIAEGEAIALGQEPALLRRRLADLQGDRRRALLARAGDGRRVRGAGNHGGGQGRGRRQPAAAVRATPTAALAVARGRGAAR